MKAKRYTKKKKRANYPSEMSFRKGLGLNPVVMQAGGSFEDFVKHVEDYNFNDFVETLPDNLKQTGPEYNLRGMWETVGSPKSFLHVKDTEYFPLQDDGLYHGFSVGNDGNWLKSKQHPSAWEEVLHGYQLNPEVYNNYNITYNPEGHFGENQLQYVPKTKQLYQKGGRAPIYVDNPNDPRLKAYQDSLSLHNLTRGQIDGLKKVKSSLEWNKVYIPTFWETERLLERLNYPKPYKTYQRHLISPNTIAQEAREYKKPVQPIKYQRKPTTITIPKKEEPIISSTPSSTIIPRSNQPLQPDAAYINPIGGNQYEIWYRNNNLQPTRQILNREQFNSFQGQDSIQIPGGKKVPLIVGTELGGLNFGDKVWKENGGNLPPLPPVKPVVQFGAVPNYAASPIKQTGPRAMSYGERKDYEFKKAKREGREILDKKEEDRLKGMGLMTGLVAGPSLVAAAPAAASSALSTLNLPAVVGNTTLPWLTANNVLGAVGAAASGSQIINPQSATNTSVRTAIENPTLRNIDDAVGNVGLTALGFVGLPYKAGALSLVDDVVRGGNYVAQNSLRGLRGALKSNKYVPAKPSLNLEELRRVFHNSERFLQPHEAAFLHKNGLGRASEYRTSNNLTQDQLNNWWRIRDSNRDQLLRYPSDIQTISGDIPTVNYFQQLQPSIFTQNRQGSYLSKSKKPVNKSGLTKDEVVQKASAKDKDAVSKMSETEFENTVLKPNGEVVSYQPNKKAEGVISASNKEYADEFNRYLDDLNDNIINGPEGLNKSGIEYRITGIDENGIVTIYTPKQTLADGTVVEAGEQVARMPIRKAGFWRGEIEDIASHDYINSIPGLSAFDTSRGVFPTMSKLKGTPGTHLYESLNKYLKKYDLGRISDGASGQSRTVTNPLTGKTQTGSYEVWEGNIKKDKAVGFYSDPRQVTGIFRTLLPYIGTGYLGYEGLKRIEPTQQNNNTYKYGGNMKYKKQMGGAINTNLNTSGLNADKVRMGNRPKTPSVFEDVMAGFYGVGEGLLDTMTFGLTDELTDLGFKGLQSAAGTTGKQAAKQKGIAGWGNLVGAAGGAVINPASMTSAFEEGLEGIGAGVKGINPDSEAAQIAGESINALGSLTGTMTGNSKKGINNLTGLLGGAKLARNGGKFYFQQGGMMNNNLGLTEIKGPTHEQGGVTLPNNSNAPAVEVEGNETIYTPENYVMSDTIKATKPALKALGLPEKYAGKTYAQISKLIKTTLSGGLRPNDPLTKKVFEQKMKKLVQAHQLDKKAKEEQDIIANSELEKQMGYNLYPDAESITFPGQGPTQVVPTNNNEPIMVTGADGSQQLLTNQPIETQAPFMEQKLGGGGNMIKRADGSYSRRGLWDNIRANRGSGKKPTKEMLKQEAKIKKSYQNGSYLPAPNSSFQFSNTVNFTRPNLLNTNSVRTMSYPERQNYLKEQERKEGRLILDKRQNPLSLFNPSDESNFENIVEIADPTGLTSWDDVYNSVKDNGLFSADTGLEVFGALPILGKVGKIGKSLLRSTPNISSRLSRNQKLLGIALSSTPVLGKTTDAVQAIQQSNTSPSFPYDKPKKEFGGYMIEQYNPLAEYEIPEVDYKNGGYTVRRSNDRKGKTHVVTGPDGTKKYFGDPKLGERSKSKYGKDAFYAKHKKNLAKNPYFRAYARATWEDGGYFNLTNDVVEMYKNGGSIHIDPSKKGTFKAQASKMGLSVQQAASKILNSKEGTYSPAMRKKANFAKNFAKEYGGYMYQMGGEMMMPQQQQQMPGGGQEQLMQMVAQALSNGTPPEQIIQGLVQQGIDEQQAVQIVEMVMQQLGGQQQQMPMQQQGMPEGMPQDMSGMQAAPPNLPMVMRKGGKLYYQRSGYLPSKTPNTSDDLFSGVNNVIRGLNSTNNKVNPVSINYENPLETKAVNPSFPETIDFSRSIFNSSSVPQGPSVRLGVQAVNPIEYNSDPTGFTSVNNLYTNDNFNLKSSENPNSQSFKLEDYSSPMGNYLGGLGASMVGPVANMVAAAASPDATYNYAPKFQRFNYTPVALRRAAANQALATMKDSIRTGSPTQAAYLSNMASGTASLNTALGSALAETRYGIDNQNITLANQEAQNAANIAAQNNLLKDQSIANRWNLGLKGAEGIGKNFQTFLKDMGARESQDMMINNLRTKDFGALSYDLVNGKIVPRITPSGSALYDGEIEVNGKKYIKLPSGQYAEIQR